MGLQIACLSGGFPCGILLIHPNLACYLWSWCGCSLPFLFSVSLLPTETRWAASTPETRRSRQAALSDHYGSNNRRDNLLSSSTVHGLTTKKPKINEPQLMGLMPFLWRTSCMYLHLLSFGDHVGFVIEVTFLREKVIKSVALCVLKKNQCKPT